MRPDSLVVHTGLKPDPVTKAVAPPFQPSTIFRYPESGYPGSDFFYSRHDNPGRRQLEATLAELEGGREAAAFGSGVAAIHAVLHGLGTGTHVIAPHDMYHGTRSLLRDFEQHWGLELSFVDMTDLDAVAHAIRPETRLIWIETPSNPLLHITDIRRVCELAAGQGITVCVDNTLPTPMLQRPLELGAHLVMHSTTKYLGGHSDILGGAVIAASADGLFERVRRIQHIAGAVPSPFDCWLLLRSIRTLSVRIDKQVQSASRIVEWLSGDPRVEHVYYPGLESHPGHAVAVRQMRQFGAMISFTCACIPEQALAAVSRSRLIMPATSLGSVESTWEHRFSTEGPESKTPPTLIRLSVGIENADDLIEDIDRALA